MPLLLRSVSSSCHSGCPLITMTAFQHRYSKQQTSHNDLEYRIKLGIKNKIKMLLFYVPLIADFHSLAPVW